MSDEFIIEIDGTFCLTDDEIFWDKVPENLHPQDVINLMQSFGGQLSAIHELELYGFKITVYKKGTPEVAVWDLSE